ncbi:MAG: hypothetical protein ACRD88_05295 [Terriglobia bacterium]
MGSKFRIFLWAAGATFASALLAGAVAVVLQHGFGATDLYPFSLWSASFALVTGLIAPLNAAAIARWPLALKYLASLALGSVLGFTWTMVVAVFLGPWFGAFSLPVLACWILGCTCGLASSLTASSPGRLKFKLLESLVLGAVVTIGIVVYGPLVTSLRHDQTLTVIFLKWSPSSVPFAIESEPRIDIGREAMAVIRTAGVTGRVEVVGSSVHGRGRPATALVLMRGPITRGVKVPQPDGGTALYVQNGDSFLLQPPRVTTITREIELFPDDYNPGAVRYMVRLADGARQGGTAMHW